MSDTDNLRPYRTANYPVVEGGEAAYLADEFRRIQTALTSIAAVLASLEARIVVLEP